MPDADAPTDPRPSGAPAGDGGPGGGSRGDGLPELDPLPLTGTSAPAARRPYAEGWAAPGPGPAGWGPPDGPTPWPEPVAAQPPGGTVSAGQPPPDGRWGSGSTPTGQPGTSGASGGSGGYRPGEPLTRPASAARPGADSGPVRRSGREAPGGPVTPAAQDAARRSGRVALLLAVVGLVLTFIVFPVGAVLDVTAVVLGVRAVARAHRARTSAVPGGAAIGVGALSTALAVLALVVLAVFWTEARAYTECSRDALTTTATDSCTTQLRDDLRRHVDGWSR